MVLVIVTGARRPRPVESCCPRLRRENFRVPDIVDKDAECDSKLPPLVRLSCDMDVGTDPWSACHVVKVG